MNGRVKIARRALEAKFGQIVAKDLIGLVE